MKIKLLSPNAKMPTKGSEQAAGYDLYVPKDTIINPGRNIIPIDIAIALCLDMKLKSVRVLDSQQRI